jgi:hypothetical protein
LEREHPTGAEDVASYVAALAGTPAIVATPVLRPASGWRHTQPVQIHEADLAWHAQVLFFTCHRASPKLREPLSEMTRTQIAN